MGIQPATRTAFLLIIWVGIGTGTRAQSLPAHYLYRANEKLVEVIMEDLFTPPVASRIQVYPNIAAYEVLCFKYKNLRSLAGQLNGLPPMAAPEEPVDLSFSALAAFHAVSRRLIYSEYMLDAFLEMEQQDWLKAHRQDTVLLQRSLAYGKKAAEHIIAWLKQDNYDYTRTLSRYVVVDTAGAWQPTAPDYANAIEPNWPLIRSLVFDSVSMVRGTAPARYQEEKPSPFYKSALQVYEQSRRLDTTKKMIALFWDCNPNITRSAGHFTYFIHKISPGGHWIRITGQAIKNRQIGEMASARIYTLVSIGLFEGFLSCWTDKYAYNTIRPETYINKLISPKWKPYIETPPFPEYPSGHSVISSTSATLLSTLITQPYAFNDSSEMYINIPPRRFSSFREAANEAAISRFYGGIHFMEAIRYGMDQGKRIGEGILGKLKLEQ